MEMATAVQPNSPVSTASNPNTRLLFASVAGAAFLIGGVILAGFGVPRLLSEILPSGKSATFLSSFLQIAIQIAAIAGLVYVGSQLGGANPPKGLRGGIFLVISCVIATFFITRAVGLAFGDIPGAVAGAALVYGSFWFLTSKRGTGTMHTLEEHGWFHAVGYKKTQGRRIRQYTIGGLLLVGLSGVWSMMSHNTIGTGDLTYTMPFGLNKLTVLSNKQYAVPMLLAAAVIWLAWRAVNIPTFADFLIATEAEINKVSWSSRKRLIQDTIVVLVTTVLLTGFLLVIDLFWGWLLADVVGVLPKPDPNKNKAKDPTQSSTW